MKRNRISIGFGSALAIVHLSFVVFVYHAIVHENNPDAVYGWLLLMFVDFPVSLGMGIDYFHVPGNYDWNNGTLPGLYYGIAGTIWWFILGYGFSRLLGGLISFAARKRKTASATVPVPRELH